MTTKKETREDQSFGVLEKVISQKMIFNRPFKPQ